MANPERLDPERFDVETQFIVAPFSEHPDANGPGFIKGVEFRVGSPGGLIGLTVFADEQIKGMKRSSILKIQEIRHLITSVTAGRVLSVNQVPVSADSDSGGPLSRREFLRQAAVGWLALSGLGLLTACAPQEPPVKRFEAPPKPTPKSEIYPKPLPDEEYNRLPRQEKMAALMIGKIPESWNKYDVTDDNQRAGLLKLIDQEMKQVVIPEVCRIYEFNPEIVRPNFEMVNSDDEINAKLRLYGLGEIPAREITDTSYAVMVFKYDQINNRFTEKKIVVNLGRSAKDWAGVRDNLRVRFSASNFFQGNEFLNSLFVEKAVESVIHETTHYAVEPINVITMGEQNDMQALFTGRIIDSQDRSVKVKEFLYSQGVRIQFITDDSGKEYMALAGYSEAVRSYVQWYQYQRALNVRSADQVYNRPPDDLVGIFLLQELHKELDITPLSFLEAFKKMTFLQLLDFYKEKAVQKRIHLSRDDVLELYLKINKAYIEVDQSDSAEIIRKRTDIADKYWQEIQLYLNSKRKTGSIQIPIEPGVALDSYSGLVFDPYS